MGLGSTDTRALLVLAGLFVAVLLGTGFLIELPLSERRISAYSLLAMSALTGLSAWVLRARVAGIIRALSERHAREGSRAGVVLLFLGLISLLLTARFVLDAFPNSGDEYAAVMQAETYASGQITVAAPPVPKAFLHYRFVYHEGRWVSQYQPGWALVLAPAAALGVPLWIVNPLIGAVLLWAFFVLVRNRTDERIAVATTVLLGGSAFFLLNLGSFFSHGLTALAGILAALCAFRFLAGGSPLWMVGAGLAAGLLGFTRVYNVLILLAPLCVHLALAPGRRLGLLWLGLGGIPFTLLLLAYNASMTGHPLVFIQFAAQGQVEPVGQVDPMTIKLTIDRLIRLGIWTAPVLVLAYPLALGALARKRRLDFADGIVPATLLAFVVYGGNGGNQYGPRYYFEALPFMLLTLAKAYGLLEKGSVRPAWREAAAAIFLVGLVYQLAYIPPRFAMEHRVIAERQDPFRKAAGLQNAVVLIRQPGAGTTRPMYVGDLMRNGIRVVDEPVVYAHDLGDSNAELRALFPDRRFYSYHRGTLTPLP